MMNHSFNQPVLFGENPDPSILVEAGVYYLVTSTCEGNCGLMRMWRSYDLTNWEPMYYVLNSGVLNGAWAPELIRYKDQYYIYNYTPTIGCWVTTTTDIEKGHWTEPKVLEGVRGIDPGHVVDAMGNRYLCMSSNEMFPLSQDGMHMTGEPIKIAEFWLMPDDMDVEGVFPEGPKFFEKDGYYYLLTAQGGTVGPPTSHCVISYRSRHVLGPYTLSPYNPIIHTKSRTEKWWSKGHGTVFKGLDDQWYMVYHAIENAHRYAGRMTLIEPIQWDDEGWFFVRDITFNNQPVTIEANKKPIDYLLNYELGQEQMSALYNFGSISCAKNTQFELQGIKMTSIQATIGEKGMMTFLPQHHYFEYEIELYFDSTVGFGLGFWFNEQLNCGVCVKDQEVGVFKHGQHRFVDQNIKLTSNFIKLKMCCNHGTVAFYHQLQGENTWYKQPYAFDVADWNPNVASGFGYAKANFQVFNKGSVQVKAIRYAPLD